MLTFFSKCQLNGTNIESYELGQGRVGCKLDWGGKAQWELWDELVWERQPRPGDLQVYKRRGKVMRKGMGVEILMPAYDTDWAKNWKWREDHGGLKYQSKRGGVCLCSFCEQRLEGHLPEVLCNGSLP